MKLDRKIQEPKENIFLNASLETLSVGDHLLVIHSPVVIKSLNDICWIIKVHTPNPQKANEMAMIEDVKTEISVIIVLRLKSTLRVNWAVCIISKALIKSIKPITLAYSSKLGL